MLQIADDQGSCAAALLPSETAIAETTYSVCMQTSVESKNPGPQLKIEGRAIAQENTNCSAYYV